MTSHCATQSDLGNSESKSISQVKIIYTLQKKYFGDLLKTIRGFNKFAKIRPCSEIKRSVLVAICLGKKLIFANYFERLINRLKTRGSKILQKTD